ncbi:MAG TPA: aminopeptidase P N-terminal domain-containing protein [Pyrinomonadaceae bacterium]|jgi:Xaa-Pro aminopeptidase
MKKASLKLTTTLALVSLVLSATVIHSAASSVEKDRKAAPAPAIRVAPPAPVFNDAARVAELASRRQRVAQKIGPEGMLVLFSTEPRVYTNDVDYEFRQENNLYYLTNLNQKGATLVLMPGNPQLPEVLFLPRRDPAAETWTGYMYSPEEARRLSGIREIWEAGEFEPFMRSVRSRQAYRPKPEATLMSAAGSMNASTQPVTPPVPLAGQTVPAATAAIPARPVSNQTPANVTTTNASSTPQATNVSATQPASGGPAAASAAATTTGYESLFNAMAKNQAGLYLLLPSREPESREYKQEQALASQWARVATGFNVHTAGPVFAELRLRKSPMELQLLQHAIDITTEAFGRSMAVAGRSRWEYEVEAEVEYTFKRRNADQWGYPSIVGCGPNATTLHYNESQSRITQGSLLLMDVGAEYGHYTADVTRTFPVNGKFTPEQAAIYQIVYDAQEAAARATKPGAIFPNDVHGAALEVVKDGLLRLGLITNKNTDEYRIWFMHGTSHWLGMNVHDVGGRGVKLEPGMVFTNEPGIYIRADALDYLPKTPENEAFIAAVRPAFEKYKNIGVRIEDDMLVTADGVRWMTAALPRTIPDIESMIARASRELKTSALDINLFDWPRNVVAGLDSDRAFTLSGNAADFNRWRFTAVADTAGVPAQRRGFVGTAGEYARQHLHQHAE